MVGLVEGLQQVVGFVVHKAQGVVVGAGDLGEIARRIVLIGGDIAAGIDAALFAIRLVKARALAVGECGLAV